MPRRRATPQGDLAPRQIDTNKKPVIKTYTEYDEHLEADGGGGWVLKGFFGEDEYQIPIRTSYRFGSMYARYRLLLKAEIDKVDPNTGTIFPGDNRAAQFSDGIFHTRDLFEVRGIYTSDAFRNGRIWDSDTEAAKQREGAYQGMKKLLLGDTEFKRRFLEELKAQEAEVEAISE